MKETEETNETKSKSNFFEKDRQTSLILLAVSVSFCAQRDGRSPPGKPPPRQLLTIQQMPQSNSFNSFSCSSLSIIRIAEESPEG